MTRSSTNPAASVSRTPATGADGLRRPRSACLLRLLALGALTTAIATTGCRDDSVSAYRIPKEKASARPAAAGSPHAAAAAAGGADMASGVVQPATGTALVWTAPAHWRENPGVAVRKGSYVVGDENGPTADVAITAFPGDVGGDLANVNRWRSQIQMPPIGAAELPGVMSHQDHNGLHMNVVELVNGNDPAALRMLSAIVPFEGATWFFKLTGPSEIVAREKPAFLALLATVRPESGAVAPHAHETSTSP